MLRRLINRIRFAALETLTPHERAYYLRQLLKEPMPYTALSINPRGVWSMRKADKVLEIINNEARARGIVFDKVEITCHSDMYPKAILVAFCIEHNNAIAEDDVCSMCLKHARRYRRY